MNGLLLLFTTVIAVVILSLTGRLGQPLRSLSSVNTGIQPASACPPQTNLQCLLQDFFTRCQQWAISQGLSGGTRTNALTTSNLGALDTALMKSCIFYYDPHSLVGTNAGRVTEQILGLCDDLVAGNTCVNDSNSIITDPQGVLPAGDSRLVLGVPFHINILFLVPQGLYAVELMTRYWDPAKVRPTNRLSTVDAFIFANYFLVVPRDTDVDNELHINGGLAVKDVAGRMNNYAGGPLAPPSSQFLMENGPNCLATSSTTPFWPNWPSCQASVISSPIPTYPAGGGWANALTLMLDPRTQFHAEAFYPLEVVEFDSGQ